MPSITNYHWDPIDDCVVMETDASGNRIVTYTHQPGQFGSLLSENRDTGWTGMTVDDWSTLSPDTWGSLPVSNPTEFYHHYDALGSTTMLTDDTGAVTDTFQYDAWGNQVARTGTTDTPYQWVGRWGYQFDTPTGDYYIQARIYQPRIARWASMDPLGFVDSTKVYLYANNNGVTQVDPTGTMAVRFTEKSWKVNPTCGDLVQGIWVKWFYDLDKRALCDGYYVQRVTYYCRVEPCTNCAAAYVFPAPKIQYWEAWHVTKKSLTEDNRWRFDNTDTAAGRQADKQCGDTMNLGVVKFFCASKTGNLSSSTSGWKKNQIYGTGKCRLSAETLLSTSTEPSWWFDNPIEVGTRELKLKWCCCYTKDFMDASYYPS